ncbi:hypothetical protein CapIbe_018701 [Capra ibex]
MVGPRNAPGPQSPEFIDWPLENCQKSLTVAGADLDDSHGDSLIFQGTAASHGLQCLWILLRILCRSQILQSSSFLRKSGRSSHDNESVRRYGKMQELGLIKSSPEKISLSEATVLARRAI